MLIEPRFDCGDAKVVLAHSSSGSDDLFLLDYRRGFPLIFGMDRPKTHAERQLERDEALQRQQQQLAGTGERPCTITSADIPDQIERAKPSKTFVIVGISIVVLLIIAQCISLFSKSTPAKQSQNPEANEAAETE